MLFFHFFYVAFFSHPAMCSFIITFALKHKSPLLSFLKIQNFKKLLEKSSASPVIEEFPFRVQISPSFNSRGNYDSVMDS